LGKRIRDLSLQRITGRLTERPEEAKRKKWKTQKVLDLELPLRCKINVKEVLK